MFAALVLNAADAGDLSAKLLGKDLRVADEARMELERAKCDRELLAALDKVSDKNLKSGIIYSLGSLQSKAAFRKICQTAQSEKDKCPAAVLALAMYKNDDSRKILEKLASENCLSAKTALFIYCTKTLKAEQKTALPDGFSSLDENSKVFAIRNLPCAGADEDIAKSLDTSSPHTAAAACFFLARLGGEASAEQILKISSACPEIKDSAALALADCAGSEPAIIGGIKSKNAVAVNAARIRAVSEAEDALLELFASQNSKEVSDALQEIGSRKTFEKFSQDFLSIDKSRLPEAVRIMSAALSRCEQSFAEKQAAAFMEKCRNSGDSTRIAAAKRITGLK